MATTPAGTAIAEHAFLSDCRASALVTRLLPPDDPRPSATIDAVTAGLSDERGVLYRYRGDDGLDGAQALVDAGARG